MQYAICNGKVFILHFCRFILHIVCSLQFDASDDVLRLRKEKRSRSGLKIETKVKKERKKRSFSGFLAQDRDRPPHFSPSKLQRFDFLCFWCFPLLLTCHQVPAPVDPSGGTPGPVKKKANSTGVSPDKDDDSPTLEQIELVRENLF